jgi:hypothetical protein
MKTEKAKTKFNIMRAAFAAYIRALEENNRLREIASFLAESIENPKLKTQAEALAAWKEFNK